MPVIGEEGRNRNNEMTFDEVITNYNGSGPSAENYRKIVCRTYYPLYKWNKYEEIFNSKHISNYYTDCYVSVSDPAE